MMQQLPYCGLPPTPVELAWRFNLDPVLIAALLTAAVIHIVVAHRGRARLCAAGGWSMTALALISPLCALSVSLFCARIAQHMILLLVAAPLIASALPRARQQRSTWPMWTSAGVFFVALWFWHMPRPYDSTFTSSFLYWMMHLSVFGSGVFLWRELLQHGRERTMDALLVGALTSMQMSLLGAVLTLAGRPLFLWHLTTTNAWGLTPLQDQQLGGILMWIPGTVLFLWAALRSLSRLWGTLEQVKPT